MKKRADGRWVKTVTIDGKRKMFYSRAKTQKQAETDIAHQMTMYNIKEANGKTFEEVAEEWSDKHFPSLEHYTERRYKTLLAHAMKEFKHCYIKDITAKNIENFLFGFSVQDYSTKTIKDQFSVIKMLFRYASIREYIKTDPTQFITSPKGKESVHREAISDEEISIVNNSIDCTFGLLAYFLMYTGLRKGEALALQYEDIDFENKIINVYKSVYHENNQPHIKSTKTTSGIRKIVLLDCLVDKLPHKKTKEYIFSDTNKPLTNSQFQCRWEKYQKETGLNITAHQLRHTFATILFEADISPKDAQNIMGHSDISTTQNIYTHIRKNRTIATNAQLNNFVNTSLM